MTLGLLLVLAGLMLPWPLVRWALLSLGLFVLASSAWSALVARQLRLVGALATERAFSGQSTEVHYDLQNRGVVPAGVVLVSDSAGNLEVAGQLRHFVRLPAFHRVSFQYALKGYERGRVALGPVVVAFSDPAGLFPRRQSVGESRELVVYPVLRPAIGLTELGQPPGGRQKDTYWAEDNTRFRAYREFREGDELSHLVASASSRARVPVVRTFDRTRAWPVLVLVDLRVTEYPLKQRWARVTRVVETAAGLVWEALNRGETVWMSVIGHRTEGEERWGPGNGTGSAAGFLEALATVRPSEAPGPNWDAAFWWETLPTPPLQVLLVGPRPEGRPELSQVDKPWQRRWLVTRVEV
jgi:uncharacterized protein (DUF58 family)